jgi:uracil phosphoribosyltransferase
MAMQDTFREFFYALTGFMPRLHVDVMQRNIENPTTQTASLDKCDSPQSWDDVIIIGDPMLATGGSVLSNIERLIEKGWLEDHIKVMAIIAAPEGIKKIHDKYPEVEIFCIALDEGLNDHMYIVPGLGDAGARAFGVA